jgi:hypothetical protein
LEGYEDNTQPSVLVDQKEDFFADWGMDSSIKAANTTSRPVSATGGNAMRFAVESSAGNASIVGHPKGFAASNEVNTSTKFNASSGHSTEAIGGWNQAPASNQKGWNNEPQRTPSLSNGADRMDSIPPVEIIPAERISVSMAPISSTTGFGKKKGGAKKISKAIDFEETAKLAEREAERVAQEKAVETMKAKVPIQATNPYSSQPSGFGSNSKSFGSKPSVKVEPPVEAFKKFGFGFDPSSEVAKPSAPVPARQNVTAQPKSGFGDGFGNMPETSTDSASSKYGNAKSISSDQYFGRGSYDENARFV